MVRSDIQTPPEPVTPGERKLMLVLQQHGEHSPDIAPSYEELRQRLGLKSKSGVARLIDGLVRKGRIRRRPRQPRSLTVLHPVESMEDMPRTPLSAYSDAEILHEAVDRGLIGFTRTSA